jgi:hypothetical protein
MINFVGFINERWNAEPAIKQQFLIDFCAAYNYQEYLPDEYGELTIPNPVGRVEFCNRTIVQYLISTVNAYRKKQAILEIIYEILEGMEDIDEPGT